MGFLRNVPAESAHKGFYFYEIDLKYHKIKNGMIFIYT
jgi:hypothetical protein